MRMIPWRSCRVCTNPRVAELPLCTPCLERFDRETTDRPPVRLSPEGCPIRASFWYEGFPREMFLLAKFQGDRAIADFLIGKAFGRLGSPDGIRLWLPVPPDTGRLLRRGIFLPDRMAYRFSRLTGIPWSAEGGRPRTGAESKFMGKTERSSMGEDRWISLPGSTPGQGVCLLDDLVTTGETLRSFFRFRRRQGDHVIMASTLFDSRLRLDGT